MSLNNLLLSASNNSTTMNFPTLPIKLNHENYYLWRKTVLPALEAFDLDSLIHQDTIPPTYITPEPMTEKSSPTPVPNPEHATWKKKDKLVLLWLHCTSQKMFLLISLPVQPLAALGLLSRSCLMLNQVLGLIISKPLFKIYKKDH
ncbi:hypothetical protein Ahy_A08g041148 [Arachis hypogaea]|uniref:Retrotransposon Copia-like N-terminal domain-containing protein n=1 Tax=Arachis hypogaea TaxID=3818 RepID=A0A445C1Q6_ARAHY|nr:hypothetical protein Ahy_A08g041148 [Arachis hypogaea]